LVIWLFGYLFIYFCLFVYLFVCLFIYLQKILSYPFYPVAWLLGIEWADVPAASELLALKLAANEFAAYSQFVTMKVRHENRK
jgi:nucleoside permease NupC